ncbi:EamA family transporter [Leekyejoonella antrihumi]|uniref:EamA family transporter n=2 Tax=Leekyejoonella antrihumi TaxID=1660198 RepID=A0A563E400_9MICO|nr:EamA family transporter [Leekyejoonella antrihumi]TWP37258.1 EamA family transporter [Leekyejoonella antrihumi]
MVLASIVSVQFGGALAATLIPTVGPAGAVALRLVIAAALLLSVARPSLRAHTRSGWATVVAFAIALGLMNLCFYEALARLPIGVTVTIEFLGPLMLSTVTSRRPRDFAAIIAAGCGVVLISGALTTPWSDLDLTGLALALAAGACWAAYIICSARTGQQFAQLDGLAISMLLSAIAVLPLGIAAAGSSLVGGTVLAKGLGIAVLSSVLPYSLELVALRRLAANVFGILLSLEPAVAAVAGLLVLGQHLSLHELVGMALVVGASIVVLGAGRRSTAPQGDPV